MNPTGEAPIVRVDSRRAERTEDLLVQERRITVLVDGEPTLEAVCSPGGARDFAYGHLLAIGRIRTFAEVAGIEVVEGEETTVFVELAEGLPVGRTVPEPVRSPFSVSKEFVVQVAQGPASHGELFRATGGSHLAAVVPGKAPWLAVEDVSRTCALKKALGAALSSGVDFAQSVLFLTSRVPVAFVRATARAGIPIVGAVSAPTYQAAEEAERLGICLCGFIREERFNVYSHPWRVGLG